MVSIPNAFKWFTAGHIILRGWCENPNSYGDNDSFTVEKKNLVCSQKTITKKHENMQKRLLIMITKRYFGLKLMTQAVV
jgi:hypothetical protein